MSSHTLSASPTRQNHVRSLLRKAAFIFLAALVGVLLYEFGAVSSRAWQAYTTARSLLAQIRSAPSAQWPEARPTLQQLASHLSDLNDRLQPLAPALDRLAWLPGYAALLGALPELAQAGPQTADVALATLDLMAPAMSPSAAQLAALEQPVAELQATLASIQRGRLPADVADALGLVDVGLQMNPSWMWLLGMDAPRTYLVLVQNNHELRATGGFISAIGTVTVDKGHIAQLDFVDSYEFFQETNEYPWAPAPMQRYMGIELMLLRDANWSPNLPTSAELVRLLYMSETGRTVDGVITVDLNAVKHLVGALGPLYAPGVDQPITAENVEQQLVRLWEQPADGESSDTTGADWWEHRKDFVPTIVAAAMARVQHGDVRPLELASALRAALDDRSVQVWLADAPAQSVVTDEHWDGSLHHRRGDDFLAVVDANLGYNKVDAVLQRELAYTVRWPDGPEEAAEATLELTYTHPAQGSDPDCTPTPRYGSTYADIIARCYFDYVRVYAPAGSELLATEGLAPDSVSNRRAEEGTQEFSGYFVLPPGNSHRVVWTYRLPAGITPEDYRLMLVRQSGTRPLPVTLDVNGVTTQATVSDGRLEWGMADGR